MESELESLESRKESESRNRNFYGIGIGIVRMESELESLEWNRNGIGIGIVRIEKRIGIKESEFLESHWNQCSRNTSHSIDTRYRYFFDF
jgi:hypothetical protein